MGSEHDFNTIRGLVGFATWLTLYTETGNGWMPRIVGWLTLIFVIAVWVVIVWNWPVTATELVIPTIAALVGSVIRSLS